MIWTVSNGCSIFEKSFDDVLSKDVKPACRSYRSLLQNASSKIAFLYCLDCHDTLGDCSYWKQQGHCNEGSEYPYTREVCKKSCGVCVFCPRDAGLSTALPPPREEIENDENESEQS